jgi:hypothetical protein
MASSVRKKRLVRKVKVQGQETASERQMRTATRFIMDNRHYDTIVGMLRKGIPNSKIAEWAVVKGVFDCNQKTAVGYLQYFRRSQPGLCTPVITHEDRETIPETGFGYDNLFDANNLIVDEETELVRLIALQQARLGIGFKNERQLNMLMSTNRREVEELRSLLMDLAKLRGKWGASIDVNVKNYNAGVMDDLKGIQQDEGQRQTIATLVSDLQKVVTT